MSEATAEYSGNKNMLLKDILHHVIEGNLDLLCQDIKNSVAHQWMCVILLMQFIEYLLKYQIQCSHKEFPKTHNLKKLYENLTDNDRSRIEVCFGELTRDQRRYPESFDTVEEFVNLYHNSYTLFRYDLLQENFSTDVEYFYIAAFLVLIALMECSDIDFNISKARDVQEMMVSKFDKLLKDDIGRQKRSKYSAPMVTTGDRGIPYTYPTGDSEDY